MTLTYETAGQWHRYSGGSARERRDPVAEYQGKTVYWFVVYTVDEDGEMAEEIDVEATSRPAARAFAKDWLRDGYEPGLRIKEVVLA